jgi:DNA-binding response OmpR family regulator
METVQSEPHIVIVEDDRDTRIEIGDCLETEGYRTTLAGSANDMRSAINGNPANMFLLDLSLPGEDGLSLAREIRRESDVAIIMVSGKSDEIDRVVGLEVGADDYITKPFSQRELLARIRNVLRRTHNATWPVVPSASIGENTRYSFEGWQLDVGAYKLISPENIETSLTTAEFRLLRSFVEQPNHVLSRETLLDRVHGNSWVGYDRSIDGLVSRLRKIFARTNPTQSFIVTVRNGGYLFSPRVTKGIG